MKAGYLSLRGSAFLAGLLAADALAAIQPAELAAQIGRNQPLLIIDVRPATAYDAGHVPGAINIPMGLLPYKPIPSSTPVVIYGDGLGVVDEAGALAILRAKPGVRADVLAGGFAAWLAETRLTTAAPGVVPEKLPGITYDQLVASAKGDMVLVDLRSAAPATAALTATSVGGKAVAAAPATDVLKDFSTKIGVPIVKSGSTAAVATAKAQLSTAAAGTPPRAAAPLPTTTRPDQLMVLVADNEAAANEAARQLRASGQYRFTILIGGMEAIRNEGRIGTGRMDGGLPATKR